MNARTYIIRVEGREVAQVEVSKPTDLTTAFRAIRQTFPNVRLSDVEATPVAR